MKQVVVASNNAGKLREIAAILAPLGIEAIPQSRFNVPEAPEPHPTFVENALAKARNAAHHTGLPALADDSGICVTALGGAPGVQSARFAGEPKSDQRNNEKLVADLAGKADRSAYYFAVLVLVNGENDPRPLIAEGRWPGTVVDTPPSASIVAVSRFSTSYSISVVRIAPSGSISVTALRLPLKSATSPPLESR